MQRRVSSRGALTVAGQRVQAGIAHADCTLSVEAVETTWRIYDDDGLVVEVRRTTTKNLARFKVRKPEPPPAPSRRTDPRTASLTYRF